MIVGPLVLLSLLLASCSDPEPSYWQAEPGEHLSGGDGSLLKRAGEDSLSASAYSQPMRNMTVAQRQLFAVGNSFFSNPWLPADASGGGRRRGLGPLLNADSCQDCHLRDGRSLPGGSGAVPPLLKIYLPPALQHLPAARYGRQLQDRAVGDSLPEGQLQIHWRQRDVVLDDGESVNLRWPVAELVNGRFGALPGQAQTGLRIAPPMVGLGLLEAIPRGDILALADVDDRNSDDISGRPNMSAEGVLGRFGWKASQATVREQSLQAFAADLGVGSSLHPRAGCEISAVCVDASEELSAEVERAVVFYASHLAVPERRWHDSEEVLAGKRLFHEVGCAACHKPSWTTAKNSADPSVSAQLIWPYSDLLLHDLGEGLADGIPEGQASGREWRTAPLWGLHLAKVVSGSKAGYLHDGRARNLKEAIIWHGGEAAAASRRWQQLPRQQREQLLWFLKSL